MAIMAATGSKNNRGGNGRYTPLKRNASSSKTIQRLDCTGLVDTLNAIDKRNLRTTFKMAKDPVELAFEHISRQSLKKIAKDAFKDGIDDMKISIKDCKYSVRNMKQSLGDFMEFICRIFTTDEEFIPEEI